MKNLDEKTKKLAVITGLALLCLLSVTFLLKLFTASGMTSGTIAYLDGKKSTVLSLTAAATTSSAAITMIPGDIGTPIADKLADLSGYMLVVLCAIYLEKYLMAVIGKVSFGLLIPAAIVIWGFSYYTGKHPNLREISKKILTLCLVLSISVPISVLVSRTIEDTYENSIQETIDNAESSAQEIQENAGSQNLWDRFISTIEGGVSTVTQRFEGILNGFIEATAVLIVTACVIPILVLIFMYWMIKLILGIDAPMPRSLKQALERMSRQMPEQNQS
ncbi:MAG: hypothetical protein IJ252_09935 [Solobacterium sp.]|nr:hypothetical protein [Solobacterium sp.]